MGHGDSGGGLTFEHDGLWFLMGVVSVGHAHSLTYSAFTNVTAFSGWIGSEIEKLEKDEGSPPAAQPSTTPTVRLRTTAAPLPAPQPTKSDIFLIDSLA